LLRGDEVLLGVRTRVSNDLGHHVVAGIGGGIEEGESPEDALKREIFEEIEVRATGYKKVGCVVNLSPHRPAWNMRVAIYLVAEFEGEPKKTVDIDPHWYSKDELPLGDMWPDNQKTAPLVLADKRIAGIFLYDTDGEIAEQELRDLAEDEPIPDAIA
jgi:ADP-ribose pyrophosphatase YjhB (NUDIX family)